MSPLERLGLEVVAFTLIGRRMEASVLLVLIDADGSLCSHSKLGTARRWRMIEDVETNRGAIKTRICLLRQCLDDLGFPNAIETDPEGNGYTLPKPMREMILTRLIEEAKR